MELTVSSRGTFPLWPGLLKGHGQNPFRTRREPLTQSPRCIPPARRPCHRHPFVSHAGCGALDPQCPARRQVVWPDLPWSAAVGLGRSPHPRALARLGLARPPTRLQPTVALPASRMDGGGMWGYRLGALGGSVAEGGGGGHIGGLHVAAGRSGSGGAMTRPGCRSPCVVFGAGANRRGPKR